MSAFKSGDRVRVVEDVLHHGEWIGWEGEVRAGANDFDVPVTLSIGIRIFRTGELELVAQAGESA